MFTDRDFYLVLRHLSLTMDLLRRYFPHLTQRQLDQFAQLRELYLYWNSRINVISRKDTAELELHHFLHSLGIARIIRFKPGTYVLDAGTGGGLPGIPLAIFFPETEFTLVDSIGKKIKVVDELCKALDLTNVEARQSRLENIREKFDFVVSRAVTSLPEFYNLTRLRIRRDSINFLQNGILYLKGGDIEEELLHLERRCHVYYLSNYFYEPFFETKKIVHIY